MQLLARSTYCLWRSSGAGQGGLWPWPPGHCGRGYRGPDTTLGWPDRGGYELAHLVPNDADHLHGQITRDLRCLRRPLELLWGLLLYAAALSRYRLLPLSGLDATAAVFGDVPGACALGEMRSRLTRRAQLQLRLVDRPGRVASPRCGLAGRAAQLAPVQGPQLRQRASHARQMHVPQHCLGPLHSVPRCRNHEVENARGYGPGELGDQVKAVMRTAYRLSADERVARLTTWPVGCSGSTRRPPGPAAEAAPVPDDEHREEPRCWRAAAHRARDAVGRRCGGAASGRHGVPIHRGAVPSAHELSRSVSPEGRTRR